MSTHSITIKKQEGFDLTVDFVLSDGTVRNGEKVSIKPYYVDETESAVRLDKRGNPVLDREGNQISEEKTVQTFIDPASDIQSFLQRYADALLSGIQAERAPQIDPSLIKARI